MPVRVSVCFWVCVLPLMSRAGSLTLSLCACACVCVFLGVCSSADEQSRFIDSLSLCLCVCLCVFGCVCSSADEQSRFIDSLSLSLSLSPCVCACFCVFVIRAGSAVTHSASLFNSLLHTLCCQLVVVEVWSLVLVELPCRQGSVCALDFCSRTDWIPVVDGLYSGSWFPGFSLVAPSGGQSKAS